MPFQQGSGGHAFGLKDDDVGPNLLAFILPAARQRDLGRFGGSIGTGKFTVCMAILEKNDRTACVKEGYGMTNEISRGLNIDLQSPGKVIRIDVGDGRQRRSVNSGMDNQIKPVPTACDSGNEVRNGLGIGEIQYCK